MILRRPYRLRRFRMKKLTFFAALAVSPLLFAARPAEAGIEACGNIHVEATAECEAVVTGGCETRCTPIAMEASCAGQLQVECNGECTATAMASCTASCDIAKCEAACEVDPPKYTCAGNCNAEGEAHCNGECSANANRSECQAACEANFSAQCDIACEGEEGSVDCEAKCEAICEGSCSGEAKADCQIECQTASDNFASCKAEMTGGCETACQDPDGAIFCDTQYVDHNGNVDQCLQAIETAIQYEARGSASGSCSNGQCQGQAEGEASASCAFAPNGGGSSGALVAIAGALGLAGLARRRRVVRGARFGNGL
jgi:hypothetical protein